MQHQFKNASRGSVIDFDTNMFLKISDYEDTVRQLDIYYGIGEVFSSFFNN